MSIENKLSRNSTTASVILRKAQNYMSGIRGVIYTKSQINLPTCAKVILSMNGNHYHRNSIIIPKLIILRLKLLPLCSSAIKYCQVFWRFISFVQWWVPWFERLHGYRISLSTEQTLTSHATAMRKHLYPHPKHIKAIISIILMRYMIYVTRLILIVSFSAPRIWWTGALLLYSTGHSSKGKT